MKPITLSFDNGPWPGVTERVLDILAERGIRTTFFVVGERLRSADARALAERAADEGHWIGNHTMTHSVQLGAAIDAVGRSGTATEVCEREIGQSQDQIGALAHPDRFFRPYGAGGLLGPDLLSTQAVQYLASRAYSLVLWSSVPRDWDASVDWVERCLQEASEHEWPLVVLHDLPGCALRRLPELFDRLDAAGFDVRQELPPACVPIRRGQMAGSLAGLVRAA